MTGWANNLRVQWVRLPEPVRQRVARWSWPGVLAAVLTLIFLLTLLWLIPVQEQALERQREQLIEQRRALKQQSQARELQSPQRFVSSFPPDSERQARTAALLALSSELGLPWPRSEFRYAADPGLGLAQYRIAMSVNGNYEQIRRYVSEALRLDPALSLEQIKLRRPQAGAPELLAELSWVLHMQMPGAAPAKPHAPLIAKPEPKP